MSALQKAVVMLLAGCLTAVACSNGRHDETATTTAQPEQTGTASTIQRELAVGETYTSDRWRLTVNEVGSPKMTDPPPADLVSTAIPLVGVEVEVCVAPERSEIETLSAVAWHLELEEGRRVPSLGYQNLSVPEWSTNPTLPPGDCLSGSVVFEAPVDQAITAVLFTHLGEGNPVRWQVWT